MSHFFNPPHTVKVDFINCTVGGATSLALWGGGERREDKISIQFNDPSIATIVERPVPGGADVLKFKIMGKKPGNVMLEARDQNHRLWAFTQIIVAQGKRQENLDEEMLEWRDDYNLRPDYIDNVKAGHFDTFSRRFTVDHADGSSIELDFDKIMRDMTPSPGTAKMITHYRNRRNLKIYPRLFDRTSAPNIVAMVVATQEAIPGSQLLHQAGIGLLSLVPISTNVPGKPRRWAASRPTIRQTATSMVKRLRQTGKKVRVNIGGTGEVADAINLNPNQVAPRNNIPNFIKAMAEEIGDLFEHSSVDEIVSNRLPPNTINWSRVIPAAKQVLRPGGKIVIRFQGVGQDASIIVDALQKAGFRNIKNWSGALIEASK